MLRDGMDIVRAMALGQDGGKHLARLTREKFDIVPAHSTATAVGELKHPPVWYRVAL